VPGKHSENTKLLGFYADKDLVEKLDQARGQAGRSQFLREAAVEYMAKHGVKVHESLRHAPDRAGKGGPKKLRYRIKKTITINLTEDPGLPPKIKSAADAITKVVASKIRGHSSSTSKP
jgi:hypothetical protein